MRERFNDRSGGQWFEGGIFWPNLALWSLRQHHGYVVTCNYPAHITHKTDANSLLDWNTNLVPSLEYRTSNY